VLDTLPVGLCLFPEHFNDPPVKELVTASVDATTGVPYIKRGAVIIQLLTPAASSVGARAANGEEVSSDAPTPQAASPKEPAA
jgi:hypothetical protein